MSPGTLTRRVRATQCAGHSSWKPCESSRGPGLSQPQPLLKRKGTGQDLGSREKGSPLPEGGLGPSFNRCRWEVLPWPERPAVRPRVAALKPQPGLQQLSGLLGASEEMHA